MFVDRYQKGVFRIIAALVVVVLTTTPGRTTTWAWAPPSRFPSSQKVFRQLAQHTTRRFRPSRSEILPFTRKMKLQVHLDREADLLEQLVGGERYEMNELPDSMMDTTLFVGNLDEFVQDDDLSALFKSVSSLQTVPACVVRKPDMSSLEYGFVSFPSKEEKEAAIVRFHGTEFRGRRLKVEEIKDTPGVRRVRIPEKMIAYVSGRKKACGSTSNTIHQNSLRRVSQSKVVQPSNNNNNNGRKRKQQSKQPAMPRLNDKERAELDRATKKGFVTIAGAGNNRRTRRGSPLAKVHRQVCDARGKPQICVYKATGGSRPLDQVVVDLSPLRLYGLFDNDIDVDDYIVRWKAEILTAASGNNMQLCGNMDEFDNEECDVDEISDNVECVTLEVTRETQQAWATKPIGELPELLLIFQGERTNAKAMAKVLAVLWDIPEKAESDAFSKNRKNKKGGKTKLKGLRQQRKRGGGHRQALA